MEAEDDEGNVYYTNYLTGESAWSLPTSHLEEVQGWLFLLAFVFSFFAALDNFMWVNGHNSLLFRFLCLVMYVFPHRFQGLFDDVIDQSEDRQENIETVYKRFRTGEGKDGLIDYDEFCKVLQVRNHLTQIIETPQ